MTDNEIIKALECCQTQYNRNCKECPYQKYKSHSISTTTCSSELRKDLLNLFNRLQAENERLGNAVNRLTNRICDLKEKDETRHKVYMTKCEELETAKAEAYKEFAERLYKEFRGVGECNYGYIHHKTRLILKELVGDDTIPNDVKCIDCEHLELSLPYGVCSKEHKMVDPNDCCGKGKLKETVGEDNA